SRFLCSINRRNAFGETDSGRRMAIDEIQHSLSLRCAADPTLVIPEPIESHSCIGHHISEPFARETCIPAYSAGHRCCKARRAVQLIERHVICGMAHATSWLDDAPV